MSNEQNIPLDEVRHVFSSNGIKMTLQRIAVFQALSKLKHPSVEEITEEVHRSSPTITIATIYNILDYFCEKNLIAKMRTESGKMRYETHNELHHHIYDEKNDILEDYYDDELNELIKKYFEEKSLNHWEITDFQIHLRGKYQKNKAQLK